MKEENLPILRKQFVCLKKYKYLMLPLLIVIGIGLSFAAEHKEHLLIVEPTFVPEKKEFKIFLNGEYEDYLEFIKDQPKEKKLEWKQFQEIRELGNKLGSVVENSDPKILAILQLSRGKNIEKMFNELKASAIIEKDESLFEATFFKYMANLGDNSPEVFTKELYADLMRIKKATSLLKKEGGSEAFTDYKERLARLLELDMGSPLNQHLLKEALKKHIYTVDEIQKVKAYLLALPSDKLCAIIHGECEGEYHFLESPGCPQSQK